MAIEIKVPNLPESVSSATVATWHVQQGDAVAREQNLLDLETDKVMLEVPAVEGGVLTEIRVQAGATVQAGDVLGVIEAGAAAPEKKAEAAAPAKAEAPAKAAPTAAADNESQSPAVRKLLSELGLAAADIPASGRGGRLTVEDVRTYAEQQKSKPVAQPSAPKATAPAPAPARLAPGARAEQRVPL